MNKPNIFTFATSELSQDAFICWLVDWANPKYPNSQPLLYGCSINFLKTCFSLHCQEFPTEISELIIKRQYKNIDIAIIINKNIIVLIEDKTYTKQHSNQLSTYKKTIEEDGFNTIIPIYYKIIEQSDIKDIYEGGYKIIDRNIMLNILKNSIDQGVSDSILLDYYEHLQNIDRSVLSYLSSTNWEYASWIGFYNSLTKFLDLAHWDYVPNPSGGFLGLWWCVLEYTDFQLYLQLEQEKLCFKIYVPKKENQTYYRNLWSNEIIEYAKKINCPVIKPKKSGTGNTMTVALWDGDYRIWKDGHLDIENTIKNLISAENILKDVAKAHHFA